MSTPKDLAHRVLLREFSVGRLFYYENFKTHVKLENTTPIACHRFQSYGDLAAFLGSFLFCS